MRVDQQPAFDVENVNQRPSGCCIHAIEFIVAFLYKQLDEYNANEQNLYIYYYSICCH